MTSKSGIEPEGSRRSLYGLLGATGLSVTGNAMVLVLIPWLVLETTGSPSSAGLIGAVGGVAGFLALFFGGGLLDRFNRKHLAIGADLLSAVSVVALPIVAVLFGLNLATIVILVAAGALFDGPGRAAREAQRPTVSELSGTGLERVNALGEVADGIGFLAGPGLAGLLVAAIGVTSSLWVATGVFVVAAAIAAVAISHPRVPAAATTETSYLRSSIDGLKVVWHDRVLRSTAIMLALFGFFLAPILLVLTIHFEASNRSAALGAVISAFSLGGIGGALSYAAIAPRLSRRPALLGSIGVASLGIVAMALALGSFPLLIAVAIITGLSSGPTGPVLSVLMQERAADEHRGRVLATMGALELIAAPLAIAITGVFTEMTSPRIALLIIGTGLVGTTVYAFATPGLRRIERGDTEHSKHGQGPSTEAGS